MRCRGIHSAVFLTTLLSLICISGLHPACAGQQETSAARETKTVSAGNRFGLKLLGELFKKDCEKNLLVSPTSIVMALEMTYNGAHGQTKKAMEQALQLQGISLNTINQENGSLLAAWNRPNQPVQLKVANSLWIRKNSVISPDFIAVTRKFYGAEIGDLAGAPANVNAWVSKATNEKIKSILTPLDVQPDTQAILANAVYFKGDWSNPFEPAATEDAPFNLLNGRQKTCKMMSHTAGYGYYKGDHFQAVQLLYNGSPDRQISMILVLPDADTRLSALMQGLTAEKWKQWTSKLEKRFGRLQMPRFRFEYETELREPLTALGMGIAFDKKRADFQNISRTPLFISKVKHKTYIHVDEKGTEAAAATAVIMRPKGAARTAFHLVLDRPFFCAIQDQTSGAILFAGSVVDPL